jgi:hypothetical protein
MSVGIQSSRDSNYDKITESLICDAVDVLILWPREQLLGLLKYDKDPTDDVISGFLLRCTVLTQFPSIETKAYKKFHKMMRVHLKIPNT